MRINKDPLIKYPRRRKRKINNKTYKISPPSMKCSLIMGKIKSRNTTIENKLESELKRAGISFSKPSQIIQSVDGSPDFVIPKHKLAIFCDGDFWHGFNIEKMNFKNNSAFWKAKIKRNIERDEEVNKELTEKGWKVIRFWEHDIKENPDSCISKIKTCINEEDNFENKYNQSLFTFIDLFAGIGGFRIPLEKHGGKCLGFSEIDKKAIEVYNANFINSDTCREYELGSIKDIGKLPFSVDVIVGGVPCQSWSIAGKMKGFLDPRGMLWYDAIRLIEGNKPKVFIFENVKGLNDPRNKSNLNYLINSFKKLNYRVYENVLNSYDFGVPQNRDRIFIVGIRKDLELEKPFFFPKALDTKPKLYDFVIGAEKDNVKEKIDPDKLFGGRIPASRNRFQKVDELNDFFIFSDTRNGHTTIHSWDLIRTSKREKYICLMILKNRRKKIYGESDGNPLSFYNLKKLIPDLKAQELHKLVNKRILKYIKTKGYEFVNSKNSSGINGVYRIYLPQSDIFSTLTATGTRDYIALKTINASDPFLYKEKFLKEIIRKKKYRKITPQEAGRLQGFPDWFIVHENDKTAHKQFGNAVSIPVVDSLIKEIIKTGAFRLKD